MIWVSRHPQHVIMRPRDVAGHGHVWMAEELKDLRIPVMMAATEVDAIDAWRRKQDDLPSPPKPSTG